MTKVNLKVCNKCGEKKTFILAGRYGNPRGENTVKWKRLKYVDAEGKRWYDGRCNACFIQYLYEHRNKKRGKPPQKRAKVTGNRSKRRGHSTRKREGCEILS